MSTLGQPDPHKDPAYRRAARALRAQRLQPCCLCGEPIDYDAKAPAPASPSAEHWPPVSQAGPHTNLLPAHLGCNWLQGGLIRAGRWVEPEPRTSGVWD